MKKINARMAMLLALLLPALGHAVPIDVPYQILVSTNNTTQVVISSTNFPSANPGVNAGVASSQWCLTHLALSGNATQDTLTIAYSTAPFTQALQPGTTDYKVVVTTAPYEIVWPYHNPYCAPIGNPVVTITSSVAGAILEVEGYLLKGWSP